MILLSKQDFSVLRECLFKLFDSNQDGLLTQDEIVDVLYAYFMVTSGKEDNTDGENSKDYLNEVKNSIKTAFGDKTQISEQEFVEVCEKSEPIQELASRIHTTYSLGLLFAPTFED